jgi:hypothetical protein
VNVPDDPLFTAMNFQEVLDETGRSPSTVRRWIRDGRLPRYRLDGEDIFVRRDVLRVEAATATRPGRRGPRIKRNLLAFAPAKSDTLEQSA